jgi:hypothetical protein
MLANPQQRSTSSRQALRGMRVQSFSESEGIENARFFDGRGRMPFGNRLQNQSV